jgi:transposase
MIALPAGVKVWLAAGATDMRNGFDGLAALVQTQLAEDPFSGQLFVFRGKAGDRVKILWWSGEGAAQMVNGEALSWRLLYLNDSSIEINASHDSYSYHD